MPRGQRKNILEKLQFELQDVQDAIRQYENCIITLKKKEKTLKEQVAQEEYKEIAVLLKEQGLNMSDLKEMIQKKVIENNSQSA
ncbi:hypothetical protein [Lacrimispora amygdalina]|uniref:hypothetical protein n=1 Tax=Lacrimispora amygdalina TaxID=253257 RepID=UPI000BE3F711|nr:hypothetical protein [Lacrimispora amygdalina]